MSARRGTPGERKPTLPGGGDHSATSGAAYMGLGLQFAGAILLFLFLGQWLDGKLGTAPWLLIAGVFVGAGGGFYSIYRKLMADQKKEDALRK